MEPLPARGQFCTQCGGAVSPTSKFCQHCAFHLAGSPPPVPSATSEKDEPAVTREVGKIVLIAAGFVLVLIVLVALFSDRSDRSASPLSSATGRSTDSRSSSGSRNGLNNGSVQTAVDEAFQELRRVAGRQSMPFNSGGRAVVEGIQEMPADNSARVNVRYEDAVFREPWTYTTNYRRISSGYAVLAHYSDGRWVLTELHTDDTMYLSFVKTNINVP